jgi:ligand-binding sensor domain-containing protein
MPFRHILLFLMALGWAGSIAAQQYALQTFTIEDGLAQSQVYCMIEDRQGNLWLGTRGGGISKFDGISFTTLTEADGLPGNYIRAMAQDSSGAIWVSADNGFSRFNGRNWQQVVDPSGKPLPGVNQIVEDGEGLLWLATDRGIYTCLVRDTVASIWPGSRGLPYQLCASLLIDSRDQLWVGTEKGLALARKDWRTKPQETKWIVYEDGAGLGAGHIRGLREDAQRRVWITTYGSGAVFWDGRQPLDSQRPFIRVAPLPEFPDIIVFESLQDREGNMWFATLEGGAYRYDGKFLTQFSEKDGLRSLHVHCLLQDSWGNVWLGTSGGGVSKFTGDRFVHFTDRNGLQGNRVYSVMEQGKGVQWFATSGGGVDRLDSVGFTHFGKEHGFTDAVVKAMATDAEGRMWFGTEGQGAWLLNGNTFIDFDEEDGLGGKWVKHITRDRRGGLWFSLADGGITHLQENLFINYNVPQGLPEERVDCVQEDERGGIWIGTHSSGLVFFDGNRFERFDTARGLCSNSVRAMALAPNGTLCVATAEGIAVRAPNGQFRCITQQEGLTSNNVYLLVFDAEGNLWAGHEKGVDKVEPGNGLSIRQIKHFGSAEGFTGIETCQRAAWRDTQGNLWFGTMNGATRYSPKQSEQNLHPPRLAITTVHLFYEDIRRTPFAGELRRPWTDLPDSLTLPFDQNHLSFEFIGVNHTSPEKVRYKWKLEGYDRDWTPETDRREATYSNLAPNEYTFMVTAMNEDGVMTATPATFSFVIRPPYWETWWFRLFVGGGCLLALYGLFQFRIRQLKARERNLQLQKSMLELEQKALRLQMNPHFIFNALNSIKGCMATGDLPLARKNLVKFAQLMRLILDNSRATAVPVADEIRMLEHYLDLEQLSRPDKFDYRIHVDPKIEVDTMRIPPMLVQPFVENSVLHGIAPLEKLGRIEVRFQLEGNRIRCIVQDNGIGRTRSQELHAHRDEDHKSAGISVTEERLKLLQIGAEESYQIRIVDLKDGQGNPSGTKVEVLMPVITD